MAEPAILDQRSTVGHRAHETVDDVVSFWQAWARERGFRRRTGFVSHDLTFTDRKQPVYISAGVYVADCPNEECNGAAPCWRENPQACCLDCGFVFQVEWPTKKQIGGSLDDVVAVLGHRQKPIWRNFRNHDHRDQTLADLVAENLAVGDAVPGGEPATGPHPLEPTLVRG